MPHPIMFRDDDMGLAELRAIALKFPVAFEKVSHGRPAFCAPKMFAVYGGNARAEINPVPGEMTPYPYALLIKVDETDRAALQQDPRFFFPAYVGPSGWLGLDFTVGTVDWDEVTELVDASFRLIASKKLIRQLDDLDV